MAPPIDPDILRFYAERYVEDDRLRVQAHGMLERIRTQELISRFLPPAPAAVLDVGGATGVHAEWLAAQGYAVHLVDPVAAHVDQAARLEGVTAELGDARRLTQPDASQDAVLMLGPLYHLLERDERVGALAEAVRVARPGAPVLAAAISRHSALIDLGGDGRLTAEVEPFLQRVLETGQFRGDVVGFTTAYFHLPAELTQELTDAGLRDAEVYAIEGPTAPTLRARAAGEGLEQRLQSAARAARMVERDPLLLSASSHLLGVGRTPA